MIDVLQQLNRQGIVQGVITSNSDTNVQGFLMRYNLNIFDFIHTGSSLFGKDKLLKKIIQKYKLKTQDVLFVGDETRDVSAAQKVGIGVIGVTWGFNSREVLEKMKPNHLVDSPNDLLNIIHSHYANF